MAESIKLAALVQELKLNTSNFLKGMTDAQKSTERLKETLENAKKSTENFKETLNKNSESINNLKTATAVTSTAVLGIGTAAVKTAASFEESMDIVSSTLGMTAEESQNTNATYKLLEDTARSMGATTKYSASEAAQALNYLALAGYDAEKACDVLPAVLNLAAAGGMELASASDMVTDAMSALNIEANKENVTEFSDKLAKASQKSNTSVSQLGEAILTVGGTAKNLAGGTTEMAVALGILADNGVKGAESGTALRNVILSLAAPTDKASDLMAGLGFNAFDAEGKMKPLNQVFQELNEITEDMTQQEKQQVLANLFNKTDLKSVEALLANCGSRFDELNGYISTADGACASMAETMQSNLNGQLTTLSSAMSEAGIAIGQALMPAVKGVVDGILGMVNGFNQLSPATQTTIAVIGSLVAGLAPLIVIVSTIISSIQTINGVLPVLTAGLATVKAGFSAVFAVLAAHPLAVVITALAGLVAGLVHAYQTNEEFRDKVNAAFEKVKEVVGNAVEVLTTFFTQTLPNAVTSLRNTIVAKWEEIRTNISNKTTQLVNAVTKFFNNLPYNIGKILGTLLGTIVKFGVDALKWAKQKIPEVVNAVVTFFKQLPSKIKTHLNTAYNNIKTWGSNTIAKAKEAGKDFVAKVVEGAKTLPSKLKSQLDAAVKKVTEFKNNLVTKAKEAIKAFATNFINGAKTLPSQVRSIGKNIVDGVWQGIKGAASTFIANVKSFFKGVVDGAKEALGIHSPSKVFEQEIGEQIVNGLVKGVDNKKANAKKSANELSELYVEAAKSKLTSMQETNKITLAQEVEFWKEVAAKCKKGTDGYKEAISNARKAKAELKEEISAIDKEYAANVKAVQEQLVNDIQAVTNEYDKAVSTRKEQINSSLNLFEAFSGKDGVGKSELTANLKSQVDALKEWDKTLDALSERSGMNPELLKELEGMGVDSLATLQEINSMSDAELARYIELYEKKQKVALNRSRDEAEELKRQSEEQIKQLTTQANKQLNSLEKQYKKDLKKLGVTVSDSSKDIGKNIVKGLKKGIEAQDKQFQKFLTSFFKSIVSNATNALEIHSPSRVFRDAVGKFIPLGIVEGIEKNRDAVKEAVKKMGEEMVEQAEGSEDVLTDFASNVRSIFEEIAKTFKLDLPEKVDINADLMAHIKDFNLLSGINPAKNISVTVGGITVSGVVGDEAVTKIRMIANEQIDQFEEVLMGVL